MPYASSSRSSRGTTKRRKKSQKKSATRKKRSPKRRGSSTTRKKAAPRKKSGAKSSSRVKRLYTRYDPDSGVSARVANTDPRYDEWLTAAQWRTKQKADKREREQLRKELGKGAQAILPLAAPAAQRGVAAASRAAATARSQLARAASARVGVGVGAATVGVGSAAALAILAGAAAYFGTTWIMDKIRKMRDPAEKAFQLATAYRNARRRAASELGRELTSQENKYLAAELNAQLAKMGIRQ